MSNQPTQRLIDLFVQGCADISDAYMAKHYPNLSAPKFTAEPGRRYVRIVRADSQRSVHCFIDTTNGDVLKAAGWKAPAKHARGNLFDDAGGLRYIGPYGPAYLR